MLQKKNLYNGDFQQVTMVFRIGSLIFHLISSEISIIVVNNLPKISRNFGSGTDDNDTKFGARLDPIGILNLEKGSQLSKSEK